MAGQFEGKVAFITGAARGQGRAHARRLARDGAGIVGIDLCGQIATVDYPMATKDDLDETVRLVEESGARMISLIGDVRDRAFLDGAYEEGLRTFGRVDFVIASSMAGVVPTMRTLAGHTLGLLGYSAAKAALVNLMENYASMLACHHIRVNTVHPTGVNTPMIDNDMARDRFATADEEDLKCIVNAIPVDAVEPSDIASAVAWLCSDESRYFTGSALRIDAGASLR